MLNRAASLVRRVTVRQAWYELGWRWLAGLAALLVLDLLWPIPVGLRWVGLAALAIYPIVAGWHIRGRLAKRHLSEEHAARIVEEGHPELENALINAVQFQRVVEGASDAQAGLMRREISRAEEAVAGTPIDDVVSRQGEHRAKVMLLSAIGVWCLAAVLLPGVVFTILPRIFAPWLDNITPPFSLTKIDISPKGGTVRYGGTVVVSVALQGPIPENLTLGTRTGEKDWSTVPLESTEPGKYAITLNDLREDTWIVAQGGGARSGRYLLNVVLPPVARTLQATYTYPRYTGMKESTETVGEEGIHGLRDTKVQLQISANRELTGGELVLDTEQGPPQRFILQVSDKNPKTAIAAFPITSAGTFRVALASSDRQVNSDAASGKIAIDHDQRPTVWFNEPPKEIVVTPDMRVSLDVQAEDDMGVGRVDLHRVINGIADNATTLYQGEPAKTTGSRQSMDMADLGVRPGDEITYYADAYDNDPGRPNYAETEPYKIHVVSAEEFKKLIKDKRDSEQLAREVSDIKGALGSIAERQQELAERMEKLAKELKQKPGDPALNKAMAAAQQEQKKLQEEAQALAKRLQDYAKSPSASPIESALKEKVAEAAKNLAKAANEAMKGAQSSNPAVAAQSARKAAESLQKTTGAAEKSVGQAIKSIEKIAPLYQDVERFKALLDRQGQLVLQARQFEQSSPSDEAARSKMDAIATEQRQIGEELKALQQDLRQHAADAQKDFPKASASAVKIADEIASRQIPELMNAAQDDFSQERGPGGFSNAEKALEQMQAMMAQGGACQSASKGELDIKLSQSLGKSGLGQSLGMCMGSGQGQGRGMGSGIGMGSGSGSGGQMSEGSGSPSEGSSQGSPVAYTMSTSNFAGKAGTKRMHARNRREGTPADLSSDRIEVMQKDEKKPPKASDSARRGYPPEYRKLIKDYFISVTKEKK